MVFSIDMTFYDCTLLVDLEDSSVLGHPDHYEPPGCGLKRSGAKRPLPKASTLSFLMIPDTCFYAWLHFVTYVCRVSDAPLMATSPQSLISQSRLHSYALWGPVWQPGASSSSLPQQSQNLAQGRKARLQAGAERTVIGLE